MSKKIILTVLPLIIGLGFVYLSISNLSIEERENLIKNVRDVNYIWLFLSLILGTLSHVFRAMRWSILLKTQKIEAPFFLNFISVMICYLSNLGIPRSGEFLRAATFSTYTKSSFQPVFGTIVVERVIDLIMLGSIIIICLIFNFEALSNAIEYGAFFKALIGVLLLFFGFIIFLLKSTSKIAVFINKKFGGIKEGVLSIFKIENIWEFLLQTFLIWTCYVLMFYVIKMAINLSNEELTLNVIMVGFVAGTLALVSTNGGIGIYPFTIGEVFRYFGLDIDLALSYGWIHWAAQTFLVIFLGSISFLALPLFSKKGDVKSVED